MGKANPLPVVPFTHRIREDGEIFSSEEGRDTSSDTTPLASVAGSVRMRSTDSDRSVRATPKKARDASPPPQDDLWVVVKNLSQQSAAQQAELDALSNTIALQQKATANLEKILSNLEKVIKNMASQIKSTNYGYQAKLRPCSRLNHIPPLYSRSNPGSPDGACLQDRPPYHKTRCSIPHNGPRRPITKHHPAPRAPKQANPLAYSAKLPTSPSRPDSTNSPTSTTITADPRSQCCQHQQQTSCYPPYRQEHQALGHLRDLHHLIQILLYCPWIRCHPASAIYDAVDCLKCPTALLQFCDIALDDGPLRPASSTGITDMAISAPDTTTKRGSTAARSKKAASIKRGDSLAAPISNSVIGPEKEDASLLKRKRARKDGGVPTQRKRTCKVATQPVVEELVILEERLEVKEEENKDIGSTSAVRRPYRTSKKPANTLATAGDTMPTEDGLKAMAYIVSSLRIASRPV
ncbi:hypothetical protein BASA61_000795 [Batrachochytrium salamandrivorans]|nr:hypothetical protein BASA61_000795 [Batrachochytrium salamandrivorans]